MQEGNRLLSHGVCSKRLIQNVLSRFMLKCSNFRLKGQENTPHTVRISPLLVGCTVLR